MTHFVEVNLRSRLLCCESLEEFLLERPELSGANAVSDRASRHELFGNLNQIFSSSSSVQEKLQISSLFRDEQISLSSAGGEENINGVVVEFGVKTGVDAFAAYSDLKTSWYESKDRKLVEGDLAGEAQRIHGQLFEAVAHAARHSGSMSKEVPGPPPPGFALISILSLDGISFGMGTSRELASDIFGGPVIRAVLELRKLILSSTRTSELP